MRSKTAEDTELVNLSGMIDILFILIIFFLVTTTFKEEEIDHEVTLPQDARNQSLSESSNDLIKINIRKNGAFVVMGKQMTEEEMSRMPSTSIWRTSCRSAVTWVSQGPTSHSKPNREAKIRNASTRSS
jgi:biopolymer transport protein ExbD